METINNKETNSLVKVVIIQALEYFRFTQMLSMILSYTVALFIIFFINLGEYVLKGVSSTPAIEEVPKIFQYLPSFNFDNGGLIKRNCLGLDNLLRD